MNVDKEIYRRQVKSLMESIIGSYDTSDTLLSVSFSVTIDKLAIELRVIFNFRNERDSSQGLWALAMNGIPFLAHLSAAHLPSGRRCGRRLRCKVHSFSNSG
ncbi:hypothetical protein CEXT_67351 [Caerostris extrusa]|uniref:Uncharacterized protein n=1 Tax=Caerostris extrusa TaxID=172846 RepID=A0AAV4NRF9_CAEEX|nr:hypothetical protein CEXT_67351 [Caerostris extrusa]